MSWTIIAEAAACTAVAALTIHDYRRNRRLPYAIAGIFVVSLFLAFKEALSIEQLIAIPILCAITYTDTTYRSVSIGLLIVIATFALFAGATGGLLWLTIGIVAALILFLTERLTPIGDLLTVASVITLFHGIGLIATMLGVGLCLFGTLHRGSTLPNIERIARSKWPLAGLITAGALAANAVVAIALPAPFAGPDALRLLGMP